MKKYLLSLTSNSDQIRRNRTELWRHPEKSIPFSFKTILMMLALCMAGINVMAWSSNAKATNNINTQKGQVLASVIIPNYSGDHIMSLWNPGSGNYIKKILTEGLPDVEPPAPKIRVVGNGQVPTNINDGDNTPHVGELTDFGNVITNKSLARSYTIQNVGLSNLTIKKGDIKLVGGDASSFSVSGIRLPATISPNGSISFTVTFAPGLSMTTKSTTLHVVSNDANQGDYDFAIQGTGTNTYIYTGSGNWTDEAKWSPSYPGLEIPAGYTAVVNFGTLNIPFATTITNNGILINNGTISNSGGTFNNQGTFKGSGEYTAAITNPVGGTFSPGNSPGCPVFSSGFTNSGTLSIEVEHTNIPCSGHDQIQVTGGNTIINPGSALIFNQTGSFVPNPLGDIITFITTTSGNLTGTFSTVTINSPLTAANWTVVYNYPNAGDVSLRYSFLGATTSQTADCNGAGLGTASVTGSGGGTPYTYLWSGGQTTQSISGLTAGSSHTVTVTENNGVGPLSATRVVHIKQITLASYDQINVICNGGATGQASVSISDGNTPYSYVWSPAPAAGQITSTATGLPIGNYQVVVTDGASVCQVTRTFNITQPTPVSIFVTNNQPVTCNGGSNGTLTVNAFGGTGQLTFDWDGGLTPTGDGTNTVTGLSAGIHTLVVTDAALCTGTQTFTVTEPAVLTVGGTPTNILCNGANNGSITPNVTGGNSPYSYSWSNSATTATISGLSVGTYIVNVTDAGLCTASQTFTITQPAALVASAVSTTNVLCFGGATGSATVTASGGTTAYGFSWSNGGTSATRSGLAAGSYTATVTDANGCQSQQVFTITQPGSAVVSSVVSTTNVQCFGGANGAATVTATGGTGSYTYSWAPGGGTSATRSNLSANISYTATVTDVPNGCASSQVITLTQPATAVVAVSAGQTDLTCNGSNNGSATVSAAGGSGSYTYSWSPSGGTSATASNLAAGPYTATVTDVPNGCTATQTFSITQPSAIVIDETITNVQCFGQNNGSVTTTVSGGAGGPYTYAWAPGGQTTSGISGLSGGLYTLTVTDNGSINSCTNTEIFNVSASLAPLNASAPIGSTTPVLCFGGSTGTATVSVTGGTTPYTFAWSPVGGTAQTGTGMSQGAYTVTVTDANLCSDVQTFNITQPTQVTVVLVTSGSPMTTPLTCNGGNNGQIKVYAEGGTGQLMFDWSPGTPTGEGTDHITGLSAGTYTVNVTDQNACTAQLIYTLTQPTPISIPGPANNITCNGLTDGSINANVSGGTPGYTYLWSNSATTASISSLSAGSYNVTVTDANSCTSSATFTIIEPAVLTSGIAGQVNVACKGASTGSGTVSATGGTTPYVYSWSGGGTSATKTGLAAGTHIVSVTDHWNCSTSSHTFTITEPAFVLETGLQTKTDVTCNGGTNGSAMVSASGGAGGYTYGWAPSGGTTSSATGLSAGTYTVTITDAGGCAQTVIIVISQPAAITRDLNATTQVNVSCFGGNNGSVTTSATGGNGGPYTYSWSSGETISSISGKTAGAYVLTMGDGSCSGVHTFTITEPTAVTILSSTFTNVLCGGQSNGTAAVTASGGTPGYTYSWNTGHTTSSRTNLIAGNYTITVSDLNLCTATQTFAITEPVPLVSSIQSIDDIECYGTATGSATVTAVGGSFPYTYSWSTGQTTQGITNVPAGSGLTAYVATVTDANSCSSQTTFNITQPGNPITVPALSGYPMNIACFGATNGEIKVGAAGGAGSGPYSYVWSTGSTSDHITGLAAGSYTVTATDGYGCEGMQVHTVTQPAGVTPNPSFTNVTCFGLNNGTASVSVTGGTIPYSYSWSNGATTSSITSLSPGNYSVLITDNGGCPLTQTFTITQPSSALVSSNSLSLITNILCYGASTGAAQTSVTGGSPAYTYSWSPGGYTTSGISGVGEGSYTVVVTDQNLCTAVSTFNITQPSVIAITTTGSSNVTCNGGNNGSASVSATGGTGSLYFTWSPGNPTGQGTNSVTGLSAGNYVITVSDDNLCSVSQTFTITSPGPIVAGGTVTNITCNGANNGMITTTITGGTSPFTYSWSPGGATTSSISGLAGGTYTVIVGDANGCSGSGVFTVINPTAVVAGTAGQTDVSCFGGNNGTATVSATGGTGAYTYSWSNGSTSQTASGLAAGTHVATVMDANSCSSTHTFTINQPTQVVAVSGGQANVLCFGGNTGAAIISAGGGTPTYTYSWSNGSTSNPATGLAAGTYVGTATDANGCSSSHTFTITEPATAVVAGSAGQTEVLCFGGSTGTATVSATGGTPGYNYSWSNGSTSQTASGLIAGTYVGTASDVNGCPSSHTFTITEPATAVVAGTAGQTDVLCNGSSTGTATVSATGGTGAYTYSWSGGGSSAMKSGLAAGTHIATVMDANGCTSAYTFTITEPALLVAGSAGQTQITCNGANDGSATVSATGGTGAYTYSWSGGGSSAMKSGLSAGTHVATVMDANGCSSSHTFTIVEPALLVAGSAGQTQVLCNGGSTGTATVSATGGTGAYTYSWSGGGSSAMKSGLSAGTHVATVMDANGCSSSHTFTITEPALLVAGSAGQTEVLCNGGSTGTATVSATGGTGAYTYSWSGGGSSAMKSGLSAGTHVATVMDANLCTSAYTFTITEPTLLVAGSAGQTEVLCNGGSTGTATVSATGGTGAYTYSWSGGGSSAMKSGLSAGTHVATVMDANGCTSAHTFTITEPTLLVAGSAGQTQITCFGANNGTATVSATGGTGAYTYSWSGGGSSAMKSGLSAGTHIATVMDANGCTSSYTFTIVEPALLVAGSAGQVEVLCFGQSTGSATVSATGGTGAYTYSWSGGGSSAMKSGLSAGTHVATVMDANGCSSSHTFTITQPATAVVAGSAGQTDLVCNGANNGTATVSATGGTGAYTYSWSNGGTSAMRAGLAAGTYTATVTDANGCTSTQVFTITQPTLLVAGSAGQANVLCYGGNTGSASVSATGGTGAYTYSWSNGSTATMISGLVAGSYTATVTDANGCTSTQIFTISEPAAPLVAGSAGQNNLLCFGANNGSATVSAAGGTPAYTYSWSNGGTSAMTSGLSAGTYVATVTDANGCTSTQVFTITQPAATVVAGSAGQTSVSCFGGSNGTATVSATGGTPGYTYSWSNGGTSAMRSGLAAGTYTATVTDANGCTSAQVFTITQPASALVAGSAGQTNVVCFGGNTGTATVSATGGTPGYTYSWSNGSTSAMASGLAAGTYTATVTDANGCTSTQVFTITQPAPGPEINVVGNSTSIVDGDMTPSYTDSTNFGFILTTTSAHTYTIQNTGATSLTVSSVSLSGTHASEYAISQISLPATIPVSGSTTFVVRFTPTSTGVKTATVNIASNDCDESAYDFAIEGEGCPGGTITPAPTNDGKYTGGYTNHIYLGYGAQVDTLKATGFGGGAITWTGSGTSMLHCTTCPSPIFTPTAEGNYTFTATSGCRTKDILICVKNVYHSGSGINTLIKVCHQSNSGPQSFAISLRNVNQHIAGHAGDELGECGNTCGNLKRNVVVTEIIVDQEDLEITCTPNPFNQSFRLNYTSASDDESTVNIYGMTGNLIESVHASGFTNEILLGNNLPAGIYTVSFVQGSNKRTFRMIKVN